MSKRKKVPNSHDGYAVTCKKTAHRSVFTKQKGIYNNDFAKPLDSVMSSTFWTAMLTFLAAGSLRHLLSVCG